MAEEKQDEVASWLFLQWRLESSGLTVAMTSLANEAVAEEIKAKWRRLGCACPFYTFGCP